MWNNCCCSKSPECEDPNDWCEGNRKVKGRFGVAFVAETPCCCPEPIGWQVEFCDTPSKVEQRCMEMIQWANRPPLPRCDPCPPLEVVSPCFPPKCNPCCPNTNPCSPCGPCGPCGPCLPCNPCGPPCMFESRPRRKCSCCPASSKKKCSCSKSNSNRKRCACQENEEFCDCCPRKRDGRRRRENGSPNRPRNKSKGNVYDDEIPVKESRQRSKSKDQALSIVSSTGAKESSDNKRKKCNCAKKLELCREFLTAIVKNYKSIMQSREETQQNRHHDDSFDSDCRCEDKMKNVYEKLKQFYKNFDYDNEEEESHQESSRNTSKGSSIEKFHQTSDVYRLDCINLGVQTLNTENKYCQSQRSNYEKSAGEMYKIEEESFDFDPTPFCLTELNKTADYCDLKRFKSRDLINKMSPPDQSWDSQAWRRTQTLASVCIENCPDEVFRRLVRVRSMIFRLIEVIQRFLNTVFGMLPAREGEGSSVLS
nr:uncharacterized protein LOC111424172 [Onthophagus taurus]